jgi:hypothetical protein
MSSVLLYSLLLHAFFLHLLTVSCDKSFPTFLFPKQTNSSGLQSGSELYWLSDSRLPAKLVPTFVDRRCRMVSATNLQGRVLGSLDWSCYFFFQAAPQLYSRVWVDPVPDSLLLRKFGSAGNRTLDVWICSQELWPLDHRGGHSSSTLLLIFKTLASPSWSLSNCMLQLFHPLW